MEQVAFLPAFGNRPERLVGRESQIADFVKGLRSVPGHPNRATVFIGQRGMGKTAMLLELAAQAEVNGFVAAKATAGDSLLDELLAALKLAGAKYVNKKSRIQGFNLSALGFGVGLSFTDEVEQQYGFRTKLTLLCDLLAKHGKGVLLLVDEITAASPQLRQLATSYQDLVGEGKNIAMAMAGLPAAMSDVLNDSILTFLNRATKVTLGLLPVSEVQAYFSKTFTDLDKQISLRDLESAATATHGYPYLLQLIGYYILDLVGDSPKITSQLVQAAINTSRKALAESIFQPSLRPVTRMGMAFLEAMAADPGPSRVADVATRMGVSADSAQQHRANLIAQGLIASPRRGEVEYTLPFMREYLRGQL